MYISHVYAVCIGSLRLTLPLIKGLYCLAELKCEPSVNVTFPFFELKGGCSLFRVV